MATPKPASPKERGTEVHNCVAGENWRKELFHTVYSEISLQLAKNVFASFGGAIGNALLKAFKAYNVKIKPGQSLHYTAKARYDGPKTGWLFRVSMQPSGNTC